MNKLLICGFLLIVVCGINAQIPITAGTYFPPNTPITEDGVPILQRPYSRGQAVHYPGPSNLEHYSTLVNDPYVSTEDLGSIIGSRPRPQPRQRPELRSGPESRTDDRIRWTSSSQQSSYSQSQYPSTQQRQQHQQSQSQPQRSRYESYSNSLNTYQPRGSYGGGNDEWVVESKGDNHITYRRRITDTRQQGYEWQSRPTYQRFDTQDGQVAAKVVDMRTNRRDPERRVGASATRRTSSTETQRQRSSYPTTYQRPETRSLNPNPSIFPSSSTSVTGNNNINTYWQQQRRGGNTGSDYASSSSSSSSSSSWPTSSSSTYDNRRQDVYRSQYRAPVQSATSRFEPNYPMLFDKETSNKAGVPNQVIITV